MDLQEKTKNNISKTTGVPISDLLFKKTKIDSRLSALKKKKASSSVDFLVRGNPQLTVGYVTTTRDVDLYFDEKVRKRGEKDGKYSGTKH